MKKQIVIIHGGQVLDINDDFLVKLQERKVNIDDFKSKIDWKNDLEQELGNDFEIFTPKMPNKENAKYAAWKIWFEKLIPFLNDDVTLIGHSLGGLFLTKYLSESIFSKKIKALILVAAPYNGKENKHHFNTDYTFNDNFKNITDQVENIFLFHSKEDKVVPFADFETYKEKLPNAISTAFVDKGHFHNLKNFPELKEIIRTLYS
jgi:uncharacterized protein